MATQPHLINQHLSVASNSHRGSNSSSNSSSSEEEAPIMRRTSSTGSPYPFPAAEKADGYFDIATSASSSPVVDDVEENDPNYKLLNVASPSAVNPSGLALQRRLSAKEARQVWKTRCCTPQDSAKEEKSQQQQQSPRQPSLQQLFHPRPSPQSKVSFVGQSQKA